MTARGKTLRVAMGQMCSRRDPARNAAVMVDFAREAAEAGAQLLCLPEVAGRMDKGADPRALPSSEDDPFLISACEAARRHRLWIQAGSTPVAGAGSDGRARNHAVLISPKGEIVASYDKIHLFDIQLHGQPPTGESTRFQPGRQAVMVETDFGPWAMSICYDLRFAALYRAYAQAGAVVIFVPAAFTVPTGQAHWEVLLRARAIETGAYIIAAAQSGRHEDGRQTYGHSMVVDPWGKVLVDMGQAAPQLALVDLDLDLVAQARDQIPALTHDRAFDLIRVKARA